MISHLLDTNVCIRALKKRSPALLARFTDHDGHMALSDVTLFELYYGAERYEDPAKRFQMVEAFAARLEVLPFDSRAARQAGNIRATLEKTGRIIGAYDLMNAGIARSQGLVVATNNVREFSRVDGLRVERWI